MTEINDNKGSELYLNPDVSSTRNENKNEKKLKKLLVLDTQKLTLTQLLTNNKKLINVQVKTVDEKLTSYEILKKCIDEGVLYLLSSGNTTNKQKNISEETNNTAINLKTKVNATAYLKSITPTNDEGDININEKNINEKNINEGNIIEPFNTLYKSITGSKVLDIALTIVLPELENALAQNINTILKEDIQKIKEQKDPYLFEFLNSYLNTNKNQIVDLSYDKKDKKDKEDKEKYVDLASSLINIDLSSQENRAFELLKQNISIYKDLIEYYSKAKQGCPNLEGLTEKINLLKNHHNELITYEEDFVSPSLQEKTINEHIFQLLVESNFDFKGLDSNKLGLCIILNKVLRENYSEILERTDNSNLKELFNQKIMDYSTIIKMLLEIEKSKLELLKKNRLKKIK